LRRGQQRKERKRQEKEIGWSRRRDKEFENPSSLRLQQFRKETKQQYDFLADVDQHLWLNSKTM